MSDIDNDHIRRLDGTLMLVFQEVLRTGKASAAAVRLGLSQSAVSHALARLRDIFDDPLFLRRPHGLEPTARAAALGPRIDEILALVRESVTANRPFDPAREERTVRIGAVDDMQALIAPELSRLVRKKAPGMRLAFRTATRLDLQQRLIAGDLDLAVGFIPQPSRHIVTADLFRETYAVAARKGHPVFAGPLTLARYVAHDHLLVSFTGDSRGIVDQMLEARGKQRRVAVTMPMFLPALAVLARSDLIATLPRRIVDAYAARFHLQSAPPPAPVRTFTVRLAWRAASGSDAGLQWLGAAIAGIVGEAAR